MEIVKIELVCQGRPGGNIQLDFRNHNQKEVRKFTVKEGSLYCMRIHFIVRNDIVFGLKFVNNVYISNSRFEGHPFFWHSAICFGIDIARNTTDHSPSPKFLI